MNQPIICFGQQPCGFFPKRFLFAKILTARRLQNEIGGDIVFFFHDSDHDPRETITILRDQHSNEEVPLNFQFENRIQKQFSPLYAKRVVPEWKEKTARQLPRYLRPQLVAHFKASQLLECRGFLSRDVQTNGLAERRAGGAIQRTGASGTRAVAVSDYFVDAQYQKEKLSATRYRDGKLLLHKGGDRFLEIPGQDFGPEQISPTRDTRFRWMQSVIQCTHYVAGASEQHYINEADAPQVKFIKRDEISDSGKAYTELE